MREEVDAMKKTTIQEILEALYLLFLTLTTIEF